MGGRRNRRIDKLIYILTGPLQKHHLLKKRRNFLGICGQNLEVTYLQNLNYRGVEFDSYGISEYRHVDNRIKKAEKSLLFLRQIGTNSHGFDVITCLRLYEVFIRPGLEYALPLLGSLTSTLNKLRRINDIQP